MTVPPRRDELFEQCLRRVKNYCVQRELAWNDQHQFQLAGEVATIIRQTQRSSPGRISGASQPIASSAVSASYVDDVIHYYVAEAPRVQCLMQQGHPLWKDLLAVIEQHARKRLARSYDLAFYPTSLDNLVLEAVNETFVKLAASAFENYHFDSPLDMWLGMYTFRTAQELLGDTLRYQQKNHSLEKTLPGTTDQEAGEILPDPDAQKDQDRVIARVVIEQAWPALTSDQAEVISRRLAGQETGEIARAMKRSQKAIYSLEYRAVVRMQRYLRLHGEF